MIDTRVAGPVQGFIALAVARAIASGRELKAILQVVQSVQGNVGLIAVFDTLKFIAESGRVKEARRWMS